MLKNNMAWFILFTHISENYFLKILEQQNKYV
jgi:hypothetical protein